MLNLKQGYGLLVLGFPSLVFAAGVNLTAVLIFAVGISTFVTVIHSMLVFLLHWKKWFKHNWSVIVSLIISVLNLMLLMLVFLAYAEDSPTTLSRTDELVIGAVLMVNFILIIKTFTVPRKQYNQFLTSQNEAAD